MVLKNTGVMSNAAWYIKYQDHWSNEQVAVSHSTVILVIFATNKPKTEETLIEKRWEVYILVDLPAMHLRS